MKVVHVGIVHRKDDTRILKKECASLARRGYNVTYVTSDCYGDSGEEKEDGVTIKFYSFNKKAFGWQWNMLEVWKNQRRLRDEILSTIWKENPSIVHLHEYALLPLMKYIKKKGIKIIYDVHEDTPREQKACCSQSLNKWIGTAIEYWTEIKEGWWSRQADGIIAATPHIKKRFEKVTKVLSCVRNYPLLSDIQYQNDNMEQRESIVCYSGGMGEDRGISKLCEFSKKINGMCLLAGNIGKDYENYLKNKFPEEMNSKVKLMGYLNRGEVNDLYGQSVVGVCTLLYNPNYYYALPIKMFEYMAAGLPVVHSNFPLWNSIVQKSKCGIAVNPENGEEIVHAINRLLKDRKLAKKMGDNGRNEVVKKYNWSLEEKELYKIYDILAEP